MKLAAIFTEVMTVTGRQVLIVPSSRMNDIWLVDWPVLEEATFENPLLRTMNLPLYEAVGAGTQWTLTDTVEVRMDLIERIFGVSPDNGDGSFEAMIFIAIFVVILVWGLKRYKGHGISGRD